MNDYGWSEEQEAEANRDYVPVGFPMLQCGVCKFNLARFRGDCRCAAFGSQLPPANLVWDEVRHTVPYPGDGGVMWMPDTEEHRAFVEEAYKNRDDYIRQAEESGLEVMSPYRLPERP